jgi:hypothetical protein
VARRVGIELVRSRISATKQGQTMLRGQRIQSKERRGSVDVHSKTGDEDASERFRRLLATQLIE